MTWQQSLRALWFCFWRSFINGLRRALTNPKRLITTVLLLAYYFFIFVRPFERTTTPKAPDLPANVRFQFPAADVVHMWVFGGFAILSAILSLGVFTYRGVFRPPDVDVLFPTPVSPKVVLIFRMIRDYSVTLFLPLLLLLFGWRGTSAGLENLFEAAPQYAGYIVRATMVSWLLLALAWTVVGYACSLFTNRTDLNSTRNRWIIGGLAMGPVVVALAYLLFQMYRLGDVQEAAKAVALSPMIRILFLPAEAATWLVMAPVTGNVGLAIGGSLGLLGVAALAMRVALSQISYMYDQAAARGFETFQAKKLQQSGDTFALLAEQARKGKLKSGRVAGWLSRYSPVGGLGLWWKDALIQARSLLVLIVLPALTFAGALGAIFFTQRSGSVVALSTFSLMMMGLLVWINTFAIGQTGFLEFLRRVDLLKPLPFSPSAMVFWETLAKAAPSAFGIALATLVATAVKPALWFVPISCGLAILPFAVIGSSVMLTVTLLFPDLEDAAQRSFRGLMMLLGLALTLTPAIAILVAVIVFRLPVAVAIIPIWIVNGLIVLLLSHISGRLYASYNPSE